MMICGQSCSIFGKPSPCVLQGRRHGHKVICRCLAPDTAASCAAAAFQADNRAGLHSTTRKDHTARGEPRELYTYCAKQFMAELTRICGCMLLSALCLGHSHLQATTSYGLHLLDMCGKFPTNLLNSSWVMQ